MSSDFTPPNPGLPQSTLDSISACTYDASNSAVRDTTGLVKRLSLAASSQCVGWVLAAQGTLPTTNLTLDVFQCLISGRLQSNGSILYKDVAYRVACVRHSYDGSMWAELVKV